MTLYLGIPDKEWNLLLSEAEELLVEAEIGSHLLGAYPCGDRIFGDESGVPSLLCIYFDNPSSLLNPGYMSKGAASLSIGKGCGPACFMSLYDWTRELCSSSPSPKFDRDFHSVIPPMSAPLYEDPQLTTIMDLARDYLGTKGWIQPVFSRTVSADSYVAYIRALLILYETDTFAPCLNTTWCDDVVPLKAAWINEPGLILPIDSSFVEFISGRAEKPSQESLNSLGKWLELSVVRHRIRDEEAQKERKALCQAVENLYRSLL